MHPVASAGTDLTDAPSIMLTAADLAAIEGLRRMHEERTVVEIDGSANGSVSGSGPAGSATITSTPAAVADDVDLSGATCPVPGFMRGGATSCPVLPGATAVDAEPIERSKADLFVRRLLRISDRRVDLSDARTYKAFQRSMAISAVRCTLTYVIFPFVLPGLGFMTGVGPIVGIIIGSIALVCDTYTVRRFFATDHKYRWHFSTIVFAIMCLLTVLLVQDISHLLTR